MSVNSKAISDSGFQDFDGLVGVDRLDAGKTGILHHIDRAHSQQHLVFDDKNDGGDGRTIEVHHDGRFRKGEAGNWSTQELRTGDKHLGGDMIPIGPTMMQDQVGLG